MKETAFESWTINQLMTVRLALLEYLVRFPRTSQLRGVEPLIEATERELLLREKIVAGLPG